jgi:diacylglycerol O-acyltransferase
MDRLNPLDALFVDAEDQDPHTSMAIALVAVFEGPAPSQEEVLAHLAGRLPLARRYRHKLRTVPLRLGRPVWVEDPDFDLRYHARRTALPAPGEDAQLCDLMGRVMSQRLDRDHPLWEYWIVEGLARGRWALISKVHHCMVDGVSGTDLYRAIFDVTPEPSPPAAGDQSVATEPSGLELAAQAALDVVRMPLREAAVLTGAVAANPRRALRQTAGTVRAAAKLVPYLWPATSSSLSGRIGQQRRYTVARASLADVKTVRQELGGTVNDVVLAAISGGFRALLLARGEEPQRHEVPSLVPVSLRAAGEENIYENRVSAVVANLPVHIADPAQRLAAVQAELAALKASNEAILGEKLVALGRYSPFPLASRGVRFVFSLPQREIVTVTTNVPGPPQPLYGMGRRLEEIIPYVPIATTLRTGIAIFSYCGNLTFGITADLATSPDLGVLAHGIEHDVSELLRAARCRSGPRARSSRPGSLCLILSSGGLLMPAVALPPAATDNVSSASPTVSGGRVLAQTWSRNSLISAVRRSGRTHSSAKVRVRISLA